MPRRIGYPSPAFVVTRVSAGCDKTGAVGRCRSLEVELAAEGGRVIHQTADDDLVDYYVRRGAIIDAPARRRMRITPPTAITYRARDAGARPPRPGE